MKHIAIIGAGLSGLRAGLELSSQQDISLTYYEKSPSVGGRVATRRYGDAYVNHGVESFRDLLERRHEDPLIEKILHGYTEGGPVTWLAKILRDQILASSAAWRSFNFNTRVKRILDGKILELEDGSLRTFDHFIITSPLPQTTEILAHNILPSVEYKKELLLIGPKVRLPVDQEFTDQHFELSEDEILKLLQKRGEDVTGLSVKKWRYAQVTKGYPAHYKKFGETIYLAGDAFDPKEKYGVAAAWFSGLAAGRDLLR